MFRTMTPWTTRAYAWLAFVLALLFPAASHAQSDDRLKNCSPHTRTWVAALDAAHPASVRPVECFPGHVRLRVDVGGASAFDVDVAYPAGRAFRTIGQLGVSPILEVDDFKRVPAPQREAFELLCSWLSHNAAFVTNHEQSVAVASKQLTPWQRSFAWADHWSRSTWIIVVLIVLGGALRAMLEVHHDVAKRRDARMMLGLFVLAFSLRYLFGSFGPHHVNGQGPLWIMGATSDPTRLSGYGPGYFEVFSFACEAFPGQPDTAIFFNNVLFGSLAAPLLFVLARKMGLDLARSAIASAILAIDAVAIRYSATEAYFPAIITLALGAAVCFVSAATRMQEKRPTSCLALALLGALLSVQAARIHPVAWGPVALGPVFVVAMRIARPNAISARKQHVRLFVASAATALFLALFALVTSGRAFALVASTVGEHWDVHSAVEILVHGILADPRIAYSLVLIASYFAKPRNCTVPALLSLAALAVTRNAYAQSPG